MKRPAYAKAFCDAVSAGEYIALVVLVVHDWPAGKLLTDRPGVVRMVVPADADLADLDLSLVRGFDVLVMGGDDVPFYAVSRLALAFGAASVWAEFDNGVWHLAPCRAFPGVVALDSVRDADALLRVLPARRDAALLAGDGIYRSPAFRDARLTTIGRIFGPTIEARMREKVAA